MTALIEKDKDEAIRQLAGPEGLEKLSEIASLRFSLQAGDYGHEYSFQRIAVPLCHVLADDDLRYSVRKADLIRIYETVFESSTFFLEYTDHILGIMAQENDELEPLLDLQMTFEGLRLEREVECSPQNVWGVIAQFAVLCHNVLTLVPEARAASAWASFIPKLHSETAKFINSSASHTSEHHKTLRQLDMLLDIVERTETYIELPPRSQSPVPKFVSEKEISRYMSDAPGEIRTRGPRHDNDRVNIADIQILPTQSEMVSLNAQYLPCQSGPLAYLSSHWIKDDVERHIDVQFRLVREEMIAPIRQAIQHFFLMDVIQSAEDTDFQFPFETGERSEGICLMFRNMEVTDVAVSSRNGMSFVVSFDQAIEASSSRQRKFEWVQGKASRWLQPESLVCIAFDVPSSEIKGRTERTVHEASQNLTARVRNNGESLDLHGATLVFATVLYEGRDLLGQDEDRCKSLRVRPVNTGDTRRMLLRAGNTFHMVSKCPTENVILQVRGHFIAGLMPVLSSLQTKEVRKVNWLPDLIGKRESSIALDGSGTEHLDIGYNNETKQPEYVTEQTRYDLTFLAKTNNGEINHILTRVNVSDVEHSKTLLHSVQDHIILDRSQIDAFVCGLLHQVGLIQGPPGCGKTYIGLQIVRALLRNSARHGFGIWHAGKAASPKLGPILCISYTNHALDQFLEAIIRNNVVEADEVIRIGGRSKSEILQSCSLSHVAYTKRTGPERYQFAMLMRGYNTLQEDIQSNVQCLNGKPRHEEHFRTWLEMNDRNLHVQIFGLDEDNGAGSEPVGGFGAIIQTFIRMGETAGEKHTRQALVDRAKARFEENILMSIEDLNRRLGRTIRALEENSMASRTKILRNAKIIGCTTTGAAKNSEVLMALGNPIIIFEEAAEVMEAHVLAALTPRTKHLILIGDHLQLRPKVSGYELTKDANFHFDLDISMFERIARDKILPIATLTTQRRMHPTISAIPRLTWYPNLVDAPEVTEYPSSPRGFQTPLYFVTHDHREGNRGKSAGSSTSYCNDHEAEFLCALAQYVIRQGYSPEQIAILTPYTAQLVALRDRLMGQRMHVFIDEKNLQELGDIGISIARQNSLSSNQGATEVSHSQGRQIDSSGTASGQAVLMNVKECVRLSTVDNFQGEEAEIVLISTVRNNDHGKVGFLSFENRVNVMLTRARHGMYIIGSASTIRRAKNARAFNKVLDYISEEGLIGSDIPLVCENHGSSILASSPADIPSDGGCRVMCSQQKRCGHFCTRKCHPDEPEHETEDCLQPCSKVIEECGHLCQRKCFEKCGSCRVPVSLRLSCGHDGIIPCCDRADEEAMQKNNKCNFVIKENFALPCGHIRHIRCWENDNKQCLQKCSGIRDCKHECIELYHSCHVAGENGDFVIKHAGICTRPCGKARKCGHICVTPCHSGEECPPCPLNCRVGCALL